jgi:hypothetical protein
LTVRSAPLRSGGGHFRVSRHPGREVFNSGTEGVDSNGMKEASAPCLDERPPTSGSDGADPVTSRRIRDRLRRRAWPVGLSAIFILVGMVYMFTWNPLVHHSSSWALGGDLWGIYRGAHYVGWGSLGGLYSSGTGVVAFPGMEVLLAPVALITWHLHMTESYGPYFLAHPSVALVLQPIELVLASTVIFASDALAERLQVAKRRRIGLCVMVGVVAWPTAALWGHAEDALALTFALYAMVAMLDKRWAAMGWLLGFGIVVQPLVGLMIPLLIGATPRGQRLVLAVRSAALSVVLVGVAFLGDAADTYRQVVQQPTPPSVNHATPWAALAPKLTSGAVRTIHGAALVPGLGHPAMSAVTATGVQVVEVSGGPGRMIDVVLAVLVGFYVWRRPQPPVRILWLAAAVLVSRIFFEPVMTPYYLAPPLVLCLVLASRQQAKRFWSAVVVAVEVTVFAYHHLNPWVWWLPVAIGAGAVLALGYPTDLATRPEDSAASDGEMTTPAGPDSSVEQVPVRIRQQDGSRLTERAPAPVMS